MHDPRHNDRHVILRVLMLILNCWTLHINLNTKGRRLCCGLANAGIDNIDGTPTTEVIFMWNETTRQVVYRHPVSERSPFIVACHIVFVAILLMDISIKIMQFPYI